jgi:hypothetical protein
MTALLEPKDIALLLNVPESWVRTRTRASCPKDQQIPYVRLGKYVRFVLVDVQAWIERSGKQTKQPIAIARRG